jgi:hypothetical protein
VGIAGLAAKALRDPLERTVHVGLAEQRSPPAARSLATMVASSGGRSSAYSAAAAVVRISKYRSCP